MYLNGANYSVFLPPAALNARTRSISERFFLRIRMLTGVTSTNSSSLMNSKDCSKDMRTGGVKRILSSEPAARTLVSFFVFRGLTVKSLLRTCKPITSPS